MPYQQFYNNVIVHTIDTSETLVIGNYTLTTGTEIGHGRLTLYKHGNMGGSEVARLVIKDVASNYAIATSDWMDIFSLESEGDYWIGWVRFDFNRENLPPTEYEISIELSNYTRNSDTYYLAVVLDYTPVIYTQNGAPPADLSLWGYND